MESPNFTWIDLATQKSQRNVPFQVFSSFFNVEELTRVQIAILGQKMEYLRPEV